MQRVVVIAAGAFGYPATVVAEQRGREAAAVKKQNHLVIRLQMLAHPGDQRWRKARLERLAFQIQHVLLRRARVARPVRQLQHAVFTLAHVVQRFEGGRRGA